MFCLYGDRNACYLAPEVFKFMSFRIKHIYYDKDKADVWSLGLNILSAVILHDIKSIYIYP